MKRRSFLKAMALSVAATIPLLVVKIKSMWPAKGDVFTIQGVKNSDGSDTIFEVQSNRKWSISKGWTI